MAENWSFSSGNFWAPILSTAVGGLLGWLQQNRAEDAAREQSALEFEQARALQNDRLALSREQMAQQAAAAGAANALAAAKLKSDAYMGGAQIGLGAGDLSNNAIANFLRGIRR